MKKAIKRYQNDVQDWFGQAEEDIRWAEYNLSGGFYSQVCFIAQQIAEKGPKAYLLSQNKVVKKTHSLPLLLKQCRKYSSQFEEFVETGALLDHYYTETRYPALGPGDKYSQKEAQEAIARAKKILNFVKKQLQKE